MKGAWRKQKERGADGKKETGKDTRGEGRKEAKPAWRREGKTNIGKQGQFFFKIGVYDSSSRKRGKMEGRGVGEEVGKHGSRKLL